MVLSHLYRSTTWLRCNVDAFSNCCQKLVQRVPVVVFWVHTSLLPALSFGNLFGPGLQYSGESAAIVIKRLSDDQTIRWPRESREITYLAFRRILEPHFPYVIVRFDLFD